MYYIGVDLGGTNIAVGIVDENKKIIKKIPPKKIVKKAPPQKRIPWDPAWRESLRQEHYLQLPPNLSERVKHLAHNLTRNARTPYEKAIILRDYLRTNFKYRL